MPIEFDHQLVWNFLDRFGTYYPITTMSRKLLTRGKPAKCFSNARAFANSNPKYVRYIEGMAGVLDRYQTLHAWNRLIPRKGSFYRCDLFVDITWRQEATLMAPWYCGVEFDLDFSSMVIAVQRGSDKPLPKGHSGYSVLTYEPLLLGKVAPYEF